VWGERRLPAPSHNLKLIEGTDGRKPMSEKIVTLPSGHTATLHDPKGLKVKDRKKIFAGADGLEGIAQVMALTDGIISCLVKEWSFDLIPPSVRIESLGELSLADYDTLIEAASEAQEALFPSLNKTLESEADPKADTANSNA